MDASPAKQDEVSNNDIPAAFWDTLAEDESNPDLLAIRALQEESTPEERAAILKVEPSRAACNVIWTSLFTTRFCLFIHLLQKMLAVTPYFYQS